MRDRQRGTLASPGRRFPGLRTSVAEVISGDQDDCRASRAVRECDSVAMNATDMYVEANDECLTPSCSLLSLETCL